MYNKKILSLLFFFITTPLLVLTVWFYYPSNSASIAHADGGLIGYWPLDEASGATASDQSGNNNSGTFINGPTWVSGKVTGAVQFDGANDYIKVPNPSSGVLDPNYITISAWINPTSFGSQQYIISKDRDCCDSPGQGGYGVNITSAGRINGEIWGNSNKEKFYATGNTTLTTGNWQHVVMTFDGQYVRVYVNGLQDGASVVVNDTIGPNSKDLIFGALSFSVPNYFRFNGSLDDVRIYNRALSSLEVQGLYNSYFGSGGTTGSGLLTIFPLTATKNYQITEQLYPLPEPAGTTLSVTAALGEFEAASFAMRSGNDSLDNIQINPSDFSGPGGSTISSDKIDIRLVKTWYQSGVTTTHNDGDKHLLPELLVKDDAFVKTDTTIQKSYLRATVSGTQQYIDITDPSSSIPSTATIEDSAVLQPFSMAANTNKQIWITVHVPANAVPGNYTGTITISVPGKPDTTMSLSLTVLPFTLQKSLLDEAIYYTGTLSLGYTGSLGSGPKNTTQMQAEFQDMYNHGIAYPTIYLPFSNSNTATQLSLMKQAGFSTDKLYELGNTTGNSTDSTVLAKLKTTVASWQTLATTNGFGQVYVYGIDEAGGATLLSELQAWQAVHDAGGKVVVATYVGAADMAVADYLDSPVLAGPYNTSEVAKWHAKGAKVFNYGNPQIGIENPEIYRKNYGLALFAAGYDGAMDWAYQAKHTGNIWNDFSTIGYGTYRNENFTYPTTNGVADTIQWEGYREGVDDVRYLATLANLKGWSREDARSWISNLLASNPDPIVARETIIQKILASQAQGAFINTVVPDTTSPSAPTGLSVN